MADLNTSIQLAANLNTTKTVDKKFATIGDTIKYTIVINNSGTTEAYSIIVTDLIPQGANFIANSINVNGVTISGVDPALGINLNTIPIAGVSTITMQAIVVTAPWSGNLVNNAQTDYQYTDLTTTPNIVTVSIDSNSVITTINTPVINVNKSSINSIITGNGQVLTYILKVTNGGTATANNLTILDTVPVGTTFVPNSINIMGTPVAGTVEPPTGVNVGDLPNGFFFTMSFQVTIVSVPASNSISNSSDVSYDYIVDPITPVSKVGRSSSNSMTLFTGSLRADLSGITKGTNDRFSTSKGLITYVITIPNSGNTTAINVVVVDTIPNGTTYVPNSLLVNGLSSADLPISINVGTVGIGGVSTIQFKVRVN